MKKNLNFHGEFLYQMKQREVARSALRELKLHKVKKFPC